MQETDNRARQRHPERSVKGLAALLLSLLSLPIFAQGPLLYEITAGSGKAWLLGGTELPAGTAWRTERIRRAISESDGLVVEMPPADPANGIPPFRQDIYPSLDMHPVAIEEGYGNLRFSDYMDVTMGERSVVESQRLDLNSNWYQPMQPWVAYYYFSYSFWDRQGTALDSPEQDLVDEFRSANRAIVSLFPDRATFFRYMGGMPDSAQTQLFQSLYNTFDWQRSGEYAMRYAWTEGTPAGQFLDRHREQTPSLYRFYYADRNMNIASQLLELLDSGRTFFVFLDINRTLGQDSVQAYMTALGADVVVQQ